MAQQRARRGSSGCRRIGRLNRPADVARLGLRGEQQVHAPLAEKSTPSGVDATVRSLDASDFVRHLHERRACSRRRGSPKKSHVPVSVRMPSGDGRAPSRRRQRGDGEPRHGGAEVGRHGAGREKEPLVGQVLLEAGHEHVGRPHAPAPSRRRRRRPTSGRGARARRRRGARPCSASARSWFSRWDHPTRQRRSTRRIPSGVWSCAPSISWSTPARNKCHLSTSPARTCGKPSRGARARSAPHSAP